MRRPLGGGAGWCGVRSVAVPAGAAPARWQHRLVRRLLGGGAGWCGALGGSTGASMVEPVVSGRLHPCGTGMPDHPACRAA
ncbi:hypothetical protein OG994_22770 [Micromonospora globbae]|uniref:Uncharacterized protein n=1 Tax=Micromonospora globbae TaxID=1894969 RepID=A0ABZ1S1U5_9ACTN|nr:hypothetical protein [Micromonospora globbae]